MLADLAVADEAELLVGRERAVEEESGGHRARVFGVALDRPAAPARDEIERTGERCCGDALAPAALADEAAGDPPVGRRRASLLVGGAALDPRQLLGRAELAPAQAVLAVEDERRMGRSRADALQLPLAVESRRGLLADAGRVEAHAPTAAEDAVVALHQGGEGIPRRLVERPDGVRRHGHRVHPSEA